jgi:cation diffusion facilitator CzcD-associated flavoprotein CzcO
MTATTTEPTTIHTDVLVIGGGQAGLAAGYHLKRRGIDFRIVEADARIGDVWRRRYDSLLLYSLAGYDALPGLPFPLPKSAFRPAARWPTTSSPTSVISSCRSTPASGSNGSRRPAQKASRSWRSPATADTRLDR